jgi:hypothetical protein
LFTQSAGSGGQIITYDNSTKRWLVLVKFLLQLDRISDKLKDLSFGFNTH